MRNIEVIFSPALFSYRNLQSDFFTAIIDVLRATSSFCAAFDAGLDSLLPVTGLDELRIKKTEGYLTAAERDGNKVDFADYGNSPTVFLQSDLKGQKLAYSTTNGTVAFELARPGGSVAIASFSNLHTAISFLDKQQQDILLFCSGWKNSFSLEDSVCAGAIAAQLIDLGGYKPIGDSTLAAITLWNEGKPNLQEYCSKGSHYQRLENLGLNGDLNYCFRLNTSYSVPYWDGKQLVNHSNTLG